MAKYSKKIKKFSKATVRKNVDTWQEEVKTFKRFGLTPNKFDYEMFGRTPINTLKEYKQYLKALKPGKEPIEIGNWITAREGYIQRAGTWTGDDKWDDTKETRIGIEMAEFQNRDFTTKGHRKAFYNAYLLQGGTESYEEFMAREGDKDIMRQVYELRAELAKQGYNHTQIGVMVSRLIFGSP